LTQPWLADVSDTARWVAYFRALETKRANALFRDPYAERLAGERGAVIAKRLPIGPLSWSIAVRTRVYDDWIQDAVATRRFDSVLHLAAGFDTRPYRLPLPAALRWIEVDLPTLIDDKARLLQRERPRVQLERVGLDLAGETARRELFARIGGRVLIVTEGFLIYLDEAAVASLARDLRAALHDSAWLLLNIAPEIL
jgi:methyltransferase (TIGR00027 family)